jgi:hypothetical protein
MCRFNGAKKICAHPETIHASWFKAQAVENLDTADIKVENDAHVWLGTML